MCGIFGIIYKTKQTFLINEIYVALNKQKHRGPDFTGVLKHQDFCFGHNRLSIIDLSENGNQPMSDATNNFHIVYNGEVYNFQAIKKILISKGYTFNSETDTEVILLAYKEFGSAVLNMLNGMFAFAIFNTQTQQLILARDRFGQKPLFYYSDSNYFIFSSEIKAITALPQIKTEPDFEAINQFLTLQYIPAPYTIYQNIKQLEPSSHLIYQQGNFFTQKYYSLKLNSDYAKLDYQSAKQLIYKKTEEAVKKRMVADVPLGSFLSGGIDSSIITALLAINSDKAIHTVSVGFNERNYSELPKAKTIADKYKTNHFEYILDLEKAAQKAEHIISCYDQPFGDSSAIPTWFLSQVTKQNVTVALSGDGGDELFAGYQRYHFDRKINAIQKIIPHTVLQKLFSIFQIIPPQKNVPIEKNYALGFRRLQQAISISPKASIIRWGSYFNPVQKQKLFSDNVVWKNYNPKLDISVEHLNNLFDYFADFQNDMQKTRYVDLLTYAPDDYLTKTDIASMQHALEVRCPFLDFELVEAAISVNPKFHYNKMSGKTLLKDCFADLLTPEVLLGNKRGFGIPMAEWFRGQWLDLLNDYLNSTNSFCKKYFNKNYITELINEHVQNRDDHSKRLYLLLVLEIWFETYRKL